MSGARVWMITGAGGGLGRAFTAAALAAGDRVVAGVRSPDALADLEKEWPDALRPVRLDVTDRAEVEAAVAAAMACFGHLDVIVNNAGYGLVGAVEEVSADEARAILETDLLGPLWVTQAVLPHLRERRSGHVVQISTTGAVGTMPTLGLYNAAKWGLEGFSEALAGEVAGFGIRVTIAELGGFATAWAGPGMRFATPKPAYDDLRTSILGSAEVPWPPGEPEGADPRVAAEALLAHVAASDGPLRLLIGDDAPAQVAAALDARRTDYARDPRFTWPGAGAGSGTGS